MQDSARAEKAIREYKLRRLISLGFFVAFLVAVGTLRFGGDGVLAVVLSAVSLSLTVVVGMRFW
ncbi:hypothetical protein AUR64_11055 [Haloprofundus marisrubri]|uniref:Uncharacterized protein n=1 Tax=Haloprofundus marisrubri TaxID=1514971 RepID=A0A0W1R9T5_9EURY|nr:hypothetical protein [Haloprofundus marisrubri]KTG10126.1 hypothetical protein AUR64_11055 [Haloprofundus marisrubri]